jgi:hypothetical protein
VYVPGRLAVISDRLPGFGPVGTRRLNPRVQGRKLTTLDLRDNSFEVIAKEDQRDVTTLLPQHGFCRANTVLLT